MKFETRFKRELKNQWVSEFKIVVFKAFLIATLTCLVLAIVF